MEDLDSSVFLNLGASMIEESDPEFTIDVFIEIAKNSHIKYEYDKERKALICDRILHTPFTYQFNYGFIPNTLSEDGDPIDVVVIMEDELIPGSYINCKLLGYLETKDESGVDPKLIMCPSKKIDPTYSLYSNILDINSYTREKIKYFFSHYKDLEDKKVEIGAFKGKHDANQIYQDSIERFNSQLSVNTIQKFTNTQKFTNIPNILSTDSLVYTISESSNQNNEELLSASNVINTEPQNEITNPLINTKDSSDYGCCGCLKLSKKL